MGLSPGAERAPGEGVASLKKTGPPSSRQLQVAPRLGERDLKVIFYFPLAGGRRVEYVCAVCNEQGVAVVFFSYQN